MGRRSTSAWGCELNGCRTGRTGAFRFYSPVFWFLPNKGNCKKTGADEQESEEWLGLEQDYFSEDERKRIFARASEEIQKENAE